MTARISGKAHDFGERDAPDAGGTSARQHGSGRRTSGPTSFFNRPAARNPLGLAAVAVDAQISPSPSEPERRAIAAALGSPEPPSPYASRWRAAALDDLRGDELGGDALAQVWGDARVVEA